MSFASQYLSRQYVTCKIQDPPDKNLRQIVVIPCFDEPELVQTLESLWLCDRPTCAVEVIIIVNASGDALPEIIARNRDTFEKTVNWIRDHHVQGFNFHIINEENLPSRYAGPGLARKIGMDQAILRFNALDRPGGIIISFDADTTCRADYLREIELLFTRYPATNGCTIYFEHPVEGSKYPGIVYQAITEYELHLRYCIQAIRRTGFPHAFHTIGSCFCVSASAYVRQGGMNKRKAGEDFYFLQKVVPHGNFHEINSTCVYPSPRPSGRVAFGTGVIVKKYMEGMIREIKTYNPSSFESLERFFREPGTWFMPGSDELNMHFDTLPPAVKEFTGTGFYQKITEMNKNSTSKDTFIKRFYQWFNMFRIIKYLNFVHERYYERMTVRDAAAEFLERNGFGSFPDTSTLELLEYFRRLQREVRQENSK